MFRHGVDHGDQNKPIDQTSSLLSDRQRAVRLRRAMRLVDGNTFFQAFFGFNQIVDQ